MTSRLTFKKQERLKSRKAIEQLFTKGKQKNFYPVKVFVERGLETNPFPVQFMVSVPKRKVRSAVKRNRIKRLIREAWRLNKHILYAALNEEKLHINVMLMFTGNEEPQLKDIEKKLPAMFQFIIVQAVTLSKEKKQPDLPNP